MRRHIARLFSVCVLLAGAAAQQTVAADEPALPKGKTCQGTLVLNKKSYKLEHAVAYQARVFDDDTIAVIFSVKPIPVEKLKASLKANEGSDDHFTVWQPHIKVNFRASGEPMYSNSWADNYSLSVNTLKGESKSKDGRVSGTVTYEPTDGRKDRFDVRFDVPLIVVQLPPKAAKKEEPKKEEKPKAEVAAINVHDLPMPTDASDVEYKTLVEQLTYKSGSDVKTLAGFLAKKLGEQGWKSDGGGDLITPKSAIVKRERGEANLTIFVKPAGSGAAVTMMTEGLNWDEPEQK